MSGREGLSVGVRQIEGQGQEEDVGKSREARYGVHNYCKDFPPAGRGDQATSTLLSEVSTNQSIFHQSSLKGTDEFIGLSCWSMKDPKAPWKVYSQHEWWLSQSCMGRASSQDSLPACRP